jgi:Kdo2-lipid IVA lauroyltransferase/acyltransferase
MQFLIRFCILIISNFAFYTPKKLHWWFGSFLGWLWVDVLKVRRYTILKNLTIAFPEMSLEQKLQLARKSMSYLCMTFPEVLTLPKWSQEYVNKEIQFEGLDHYENALKKNKGVLLLSLHVGNGDVGITSMTLKGVNCHLITKKFSNKFANDFWFGIRGSQGVKFIDAHGSKIAFEILGACRKNEGVVFVIDQYMGKPYGIESKFFGKKTGTPYGLALFAIKTKAPVVPVYTFRDENLKTHLVFGKEIPFIECEDRDQQIALLTQQYNDKVEEIVRLHPEQWMWVHRRWKKWK